MILSYKQLFEKLDEPKMGDLVVCFGDIDNLKTHNHVGILKKGGVQFVNRFSDKLHDLKGEIRNNNGWFVKDNSWVKPFDNNNIKNNVPLLYSVKFKDVISYSLKFLLDYEQIYFSDVSFIDISNRSETISCLSATNYYKLKDGDDPWTSTMRQNIRLGRFLKKIIDDPDNIIEDYVNEYKFSFNLMKNDFGRFKLAKGMDMAKWYLEMNYAIEGGGTLRQSCMRHVKSQRRLSIYTQNPDTVKLLFLLNPVGKLLGRALVWKLDEPKGYYMDKIYYSEEYIEKMFLDFAKKKGFLTRDEVIKKGLTLKVELDRDFGPPQINPYMDTLKFFVKNGNYLTNKFNNLKAGEYWEYVDHD